MRADYFRVHHIARIDIVADGTDPKGVKMEVSNLFGGANSNRLVPG